MTYYRTMQGYEEHEDGMDTPIGIRLPFTKEIGENPQGHAIDNFKLQVNLYDGPNPASRSRKRYEN